MGVVVPEGIIANNNNAYLTLRKEMIENGLYGVVSLHSYVFEPYTNVSTLLLFFDKRFANRKEIYISSLDNDGFEKNSIRNPISENDLPDILKDLEQFKDYLLTGEEHEYTNGQVITEEQYGVKMDFHPNSYLWQETDEMKPVKRTPASKSDLFAELVCSNSLRGASIENAVGLLKEEMRTLDSLIMEAADKNRVEAGKSLAVDREGFSRYITERIDNEPNIEVIHEEFTHIDENIYHTPHRHCLDKNSKCRDIC